MADSGAMALVEFGSSTLAASDHTLALPGCVSWRDAMEGVFVKYDSRRRQIEAVAQLFDGDVGAVVNHFIDGNRKVNGSTYSHFMAENIFKVEGAIKSLDAAYWQKAIDLSGVFSVMPNILKGEWKARIKSRTTPEFCRQEVISTLQTWLESRERFFAERVEGIFHGLSRRHWTNCPEGFTKRMILRVGCSFGGTDFDQIGYFNDLRCVIARFMGRDEPQEKVSRWVIDKARQASGEWVELDGGALKVRCYAVGTAHIEVHPLVAERLNSVLSYLYPDAIPVARKARRKSAAESGQTLRFDLIPFAVLAILDDVIVEHVGGHWVVKLGVGSPVDLSDRRVDRASVLALLDRMGGRGIPDEPEARVFDQDPRAALRETSDYGVEVRLEKDS